MKKRKGEERKRKRKKRKLLSVVLENFSLAAATILPHPSLSNTAFKQELLVFGEPNPGFMPPQEQMRGNYLGHSSALTDRPFFLAALALPVRF